MAIEKYYEGRKCLYIPTCDNCGAELSTEYSFGEAVAAKRDAGWKVKRIDGLLMDLCPDCQGEKHG